MDFVGQTAAQLDGNGRFPTDEQIATWDTNPAAEPAVEIPKMSFRELRQRFPDLRPPLIHNVLRQGEIANIIAPTKTGKSWMADGLAVCVAIGREWLGQFKTERARVLLIDNELHRENIQARIFSVANAMGISVEEYRDNLDVSAVRGMGLSINDLRLDPELAPPEKYGLIIVDAKYRAMVVGSSENSNSDETEFFNSVDAWASHSKASIVLIHHSTKGSQADKRVTDIGAGGGAQSRAADTHLVLREHDDEGVFVLEAAVRSFPPVERIGLRWEFPVWVPADDVDLDKLKGRQLSRDEKQQERDSETDNAIIDVATAWMSRREIRDSTGFGSDRIGRAIRRLIKAGFLESSDGERKGNQCKLYRKSIHARG